MLPAAMMDGLFGSMAIDGSHKPLSVFVRFEFLSWTFAKSDWAKERNGKNPKKKMSLFMLNGSKPIFTELLSINLS